MMDTVRGGPFDTGTRLTKTSHVSEERCFSAANSTTKGVVEDERKPTGTRASPRYFVLVTDASWTLTTTTSSCVQRSATLKKAKN